MGYLKNELSEKSRYHLSKHRYLELKHHCLQYPEWKQRLNEITDISIHELTMPVTKVSKWPSNETERIALEKSVLRSKINQVENVARETDESLWLYILKGVTEDGITYTYLRNMMGIPCGKNIYYDRYRRFFWLLAQDLQGL